MNIEVNLVAVLVAVLASFMVGFVWYAGSLFGNTWMKLVGLNDKKAKEGMNKAFLRTVVSSLLQAYLLAVATYVVAYFYADRSWLSAAVLSALVLWLAQTAAIVTHDAFEQRDIKLTLINVGNQLATLLAMGLVIGWLQP